MTHAAIYLDHHASTPVDPRVLEAMLPYFCEQFGNPQPLGHVFAREAHRAVEHARQQLAEHLSVFANEIIFTAGATEAINLAIRGVLHGNGRGRGHLITTAVEHAATLECLKSLKGDGVDVTVLPVDSLGRVSPEAIASAIRPDTLLVSVIHGNNEIGTVLPVGAIGAVTRARGVFLHVDATQTFGRVPLHPDRDGIDLLSLSGHKIYGPKGVGALYARRRNPRVTLHPQIYGGSQERGFRAGTLNVPGIVGLGVAARMMAEGAATEGARLVDMRDTLMQALMEGIPDVCLTGDRTLRLDGHLSLAIRGIQASALIQAVPVIAFSSGAACAADRPGPSHVLKAIGLTPEWASGAIRLGIGRSNTPAQIAHAAKTLIAAVTQLRQATP